MDDPRIHHPDVIVADAGPLIHLAQADALYLLHALGGRVLVPDMVEIEVTRDMSKPGALQLRAWLDAGLAPGSNAPVVVEETEMGRVFRVAMKIDPDIRVRNADETAIVQWLAETVAGTDDKALVVYENGRVPQIVAGQGMDADIAVMTTRALLRLAEDRGILTDAEEMWRRVVAVAPTANPVALVTRQYRQG